MTHEGEGHRAAPGATPGVPGVITFGAPVIGEVLAERYRLEEHIRTDHAGRQVWRGIDVLLRRPVAVVLRQPGGEASGEMLTAAVAASRLVHPHIVSVYDAIDEGHRAYVVREWVPGIALRDVVAEVPLDGERATLVTHAVAEAIAALHAAGIAHGNVHPGSVLIADDGRVVLTDALGDGSATPEGDVRAVGGVLYASLTGHWPSREAGQGALPDAPRDSGGKLISPRQVRAGIPSYLDAIASDLLDLEVEPPPAAALAAELARLALQGGDQFLDNGPMGFQDVGASEPRRPANRKIAFGIAVLSVIALLGVYLGVRALNGDGTPANVSNNLTPAAEQPTEQQNNQQAITVKADQVRVVDPPKGNRTELAGVENVVDGKESTGWRVDKYTRPNFGGLKPGMGILIDLRQPTQVASVRVAVSGSGSSIQLRTGPADPGNTSDGDKAISESFTTIGQPQDDSGTNIVFPVEQDQEVQFLLVWITNLPMSSDGKYTISINEITVYAR